MQSFMVSNQGFKFNQRRMQVCIQYIHTALTCVIRKQTWSTDRNPSTDTHPVKQRNSVKYKWQDKRSCPESFTSLWELQLQEPVETHRGRFIHFYLYTEKRFLMYNWWPPDHPSTDQNTDRISLTSRGQNTSNNDDFWNFGAQLSIITILGISVSTVHRCYG